LGAVTSKVLGAKPSGKFAGAAPKFTPSTSKSKFVRMAVATGAGVGIGAWYAGKAAAGGYGGPLYAAQAKADKDQAVRAAMVATLLAAGAAVPPPIAPTKQPSGTGSLSKEAMVTMAVPSAATTMAAQAALAKLSKKDKNAMASALRKKLDAQSKKEGKTVGLGSIDKKALGFGGLITDAEITAAAASLSNTDYSKYVRKPQRPGRVFKKFKTFVENENGSPARLREKSVREAEKAVKSGGGNDLSNPTDRITYLSDQRAKAFLKEFKERAPEEYTKLKAEAEAKVGQEQAVKELMDTETIHGRSITNALAREANVAQAQKVEQYLQAERALELEHSDLYKNKSPGEEEVKTKMEETLLKEKLEQTGQHLTQEERDRLASEIETQANEALRAKAAQDEDEKLRLKLLETAADARIWKGGRGPLSGIPAADSYVREFTANIQPVVYDTLAAKYGTDEKFTKQVDDLMSHGDSGTGTQSEEALRTATITAIAGEIAEKMARAKIDNIGGTPRFEAWDENAHPVNKFLNKFVPNSWRKDNDPLKKKKETDNPADESAT